MHITKTAARRQVEAIKLFYLNKIKQRAEGTGHITQQHLAITLGVAQPRISDLLNGKLHLFSLDTLVEYALLLGYNVYANDGRI